VNDRLESGDATSAGPLELLVGGGGGEPERLLLIDPPRTNGQVHVRQWSSANWGAAPTSRECNAAGLLSEIERAVREGRSLNRELTVVRWWLQGVDPDAP
jgi:hypothetical protein